MSEKRLCILWLIGIVVWGCFCCWFCFKYPDRLNLPENYVPKEHRLNGFGFPSFY